MKKVMLTKTKNSNTNTSQSATKSTFPSSIISVSVQRSPTSQEPKSPRSMEVFKQRKAMKAAYEELFRALFKIPDKQVQQRVLDAINGVTTSSPEICVECMKHVKVKQETVHSATQTVTEPTDGCYDDEKCNGNTETLSSENLCWLDSNENSCIFLEETKEPKSVEPKRRKRKRKNTLPRVMKQSHAQQYTKEQPQLNKSIASMASKEIECQASTLYPVIENDEVSIVKRQRSDSINAKFIDVDSDLNISQFGAWLDYVNLEKHQKQSQEGLLRKVNAIMEKEFYESENMDEIEGFLPIHKAICNNDLDRLRRQIYVWTRLRKTELNYVLTQHDEDCMEVALCHNSETKVVEMLLNTGYDINTVFENSWNVLHMAIYNEVALETVVCLAQRVDLGLLQKKNDAGHTPLFQALRQNGYLYFEAILQVIDARLNLKKYKREKTIIISEKRSIKELTLFYADQCENIQSFYSDMKFQSAELRRKQSILNECDPKSGNTMLLYAIEQKLDHFVHLLLAHLANPMVKNYSGQDARSFYNEYGRSYKLNIKIDKSLENVLATLKELELEQ